MMSELPVKVRGMTMEQNTNTRIARRMMIVGLILFILAAFGEIASFVISLVQDGRWPIVPTIVLVVLTPMIYSVSRKIWFRK